jgi:hypothetical protein
VTGGTKQLNVSQNKYQNNLKKKKAGRHVAGGMDQTQTQLSTDLVCEVFREIQTLS